jgi:23S rRNA (uracil1939-C5)-methyltransferase
VLLTKTTDVGGRLDDLASRLAQAAEGFAGLIWGFNDGLADIARMDREAGRIGEPVLEEQLDEFRYRVSPFSFFQTNTESAALLYRAAREFSGFTGRETLLDAYCGAGTIGIFCAKQCRKVFGVEIVREAIWDARENALNNGLDNCTFIAAPMAKGLSLIAEAAGSRIDRVIVDPPRGGMDKRSLKQLLAIQAPVFVYISCNPTTMARDVVMIGEAGYRIARARALDLFPHTYHVETVIRFERE